MYPRHLYQSIASTKPPPVRLELVCVATNLSILVFFLGWDVWDVYYIVIELLNLHYNV